jgi:hypothetical protein
MGLCNAGQIAVADHSVAPLQKQARERTDAARRKGQTCLNEWIPLGPTMQEAREL